MEKGPVLYPELRTQAPPNLGVLLGLKWKEAGVGVWGPGCSGIGSSLRTRNDGLRPACLQAVCLSRDCAIQKGRQLPQPTPTPPRSFP